MTDGGHSLGFLKIDVSATWNWATRLQLDKLTQKGNVYRNTHEIRAVWAALGELNRANAQLVATALGVKSDRIPGPMDKLEVRSIWPLVKALGYKAIKAGQSGADGKKWRFEPIDLQ